MSILKYIVSVIVTVIIIIKVGTGVVEPIKKTTNKFLVPIILAIAGIICGSIGDIYNFPIMSGIVFGVIAGIIQLMIDYRSKIE